MKITGTTSSF